MPHRPRLAPRPPALVLGAAVHAVLLGVVEFVALWRCRWRGRDGR